MILLSGATGNNGAAVARVLAERGVQVRALVRDAKKAGGLRDLGFEIATGAFDAPETVEQAARGCEAAFILAPGDPRLACLAIEAIGACKRASVGRVVYFSAIGAGVNSPGGFFSWNHGAAEGALKASGLAWTILRPDFFMDNWLGSAASIKGEGKVYNCYGNGLASYVHVDDIARVAAAVLTQRGHEGKTYTVTGPRAISAQEGASIIGAAIGKRIEYADVARPEFTKTLLGYGLPTWLAEGIVGLANLLDNGEAGVVTDVVEKVGGAPARTFEQWVQKNAGAFR